MEFVDRLLTCADCGGEFIFTAGEQLFFVDKQFKNDPKRCKPCKSRRSGASASASTTGPAAAGLSRTETRTECSECGVVTTVPFKPTQGRPVLCRQCFKSKRPANAATPETVAATSELVAAASSAPAAVEQVQVSAEIAAEA
jgi:CxxC-x17-CxxC domain-containing protein